MPFSGFLRRFSDAVDRRVWGPKCRRSPQSHWGWISLRQDSGGALCGWHLLTWVVGSPRFPAAFLGFSGLFTAAKGHCSVGFFVDAIDLLQDNDFKEWFIFSIEFPISL